MTMFQKLSTALVGLVALTACDDVIVGDWQSKDVYCEDQKQDQISISDDLSGTAQIVVGCLGDTVAVICDAGITASETWQERWTLEARFGYCEAAGQDLGRRFKDCDVVADGEELYCCDPDGRRCMTYVQQ